jgi:hypothetical protein
MPGGGVRIAESSYLVWTGSRQRRLQPGSMRCISISISSMAGSATSSSTPRRRSSGPRSVASCVISKRTRTRTRAMSKTESAPGPTGARGPVRRPWLDRPALSGPGLQSGRRTRSRGSPVPGESPAGPPQIAPQRSKRHTSTYRRRAAFQQLSPAVAVVKRRNRPRGLHRTRESSALRIMCAAAFSIPLPAEPEFQNQKPPQPEIVIPAAE